MNTSMDILGVKYEFGPSVFYLFGPLIKNLVLRFFIYSVLRIQSTVPARFKGNLNQFFRFSQIYLKKLKVWQPRIGSTSIHISSNRKIFSCNKSFYFDFYSFHKFHITQNFSLKLCSLTSKKFEKIKFKTKNYCCKSKRKCRQKIRLETSLKMMFWTSA